MNNNIFWLGINIYHEARSEPIEGQVAVGHVVMNRAEKRNKSAKEIILQPWQFSWHNGNKFPPIKDYDALSISFESAQKTIDERLKGNTLSGADHYFADYIDPPEWAINMTKIIKIGRHTFFRE